MKTTVIAGCLALMSIGVFAQAPAKPATKATKKAAAVAPAAAAPAKDAVSAGIDQYREMLQDGNPAELYEARGQELWKKVRGPKNASLEKCDLGLGAGVVKGAYVQTPRYFADADRVMDIETRIGWCITQLQGIPEADVKKRPFGSADKPSEMEDLVAYVITQSQGMKVNVSTAHPKMKEAYEIGKEMLTLRGGPYDFSCTTCHGEDNKRIRLQDLPNLTKKEDTQRAYVGWPAYRVSTSQLHSMQWRINDCFRQQRFPEPKYTSESVNALITYLAVTANGAVYNGPAIKR